MNDTTASPRRPWIAAVLSLFCTGLGHLYCGRTARGVTLFLLALSFVPLFLAAAMLSPSTTVLTLIMISLPLVVAIYVFAVIDSIRIARRRAGGIRLSVVNSTVVYALGVLLGLAAPIAGMLLVRTVAYEAFYCPAGSMVPTVVPGDRVLVNKFAFSFRTPARDEVVVFRNPMDPKQNYIKRVVGLPGDVVETPEGEAPVPEGSYWVIGDARTNSRDSRHFGFVPGENMVGPVEYVFFPLSRFGTLPCTPQPD